jgi:DNA-binding PucR family transcriptional regulator
MDSVDPSGTTYLDPDRPPRCSGLAIAEPDQPEPPTLRLDALVLGIGVRGRDARSAVSSAAAAGAAGLVLRRPHPAEAQVLGQQAHVLGLSLLWLPEDAGWDAVHQRLLVALAPTPLLADDDLAQLAQTIATLTGGLVSIEDTASRVLAYSRSSDEVDDLRRLSILGRSGPADYLALLREWGVFDRLASHEEVVEIDEHPQSGIRRRLAVGVFAGSQQLATIWVQQGSEPFPPHAQRALLGAARVTAAQLSAARAGVDTTDDGLLELLTGRPSRLPATLGRSGRRPCLVVALALTDSGDGDGRPLRQARLSDLAAAVSVQAAGYRRHARAARREDRVYLFLPAVDSVAAARPVIADIVQTARRQAWPDVAAAVGPLVTEAGAAQESRRGADLALQLAMDETVPARHSARNTSLIMFDEVRPELLIRAASGGLTAQPDLRNPDLDRLMTEHPELAVTLRRYLDSGSLVSEVAATEELHATTVRYRLRRAADLAGLDLHEPAVRLAAHLQLWSDLHYAQYSG